MNRRLAIWAMALFTFPALALAQRPLRKKPAPTPDETTITGNWLLTMPRGFEYDATIEPGEEYGFYQLKCGALNLQGQYEIQGRNLVMVKPANKYLKDLAWEITNRNSLVLTKQPNFNQVGSDYRGATLGRQKKSVSTTSR